MVPRVLRLVLLVLIAAPAAAADIRWTRIDTSHFVVIGTDSAEMQRLGGEFEAFRDALTQLLSKAATATAVPTIVIAFPDNATFRPFKPVINGRIVEDAHGLFVSQADVNFVLLAPGHDAESLRRVFHEYSHVVINNLAPTMPLWLNEGLAEYYSSFDLLGDGRQVVLGRAILPHLQMLARERWVPIETLRATTHESPEYGEAGRRSLFYAESWALVHMLLEAAPERQKQFAAYTADLAAGVPQDVAWSNLFGREDLLTSLRRYLTRPSLPEHRFALPARVSRVPGQAVALPPATAESIFGELQMTLDRRAAALAYFNRAFAVDRSSALASVGRFRAGQVPLPDSLAAPENDWLEAYLIAAELMAAGPPDNAARHLIFTAISTAVAKQPDLPNAQALYGRALAATDASDPGVTAALKRAHDAIPARDDYSMALAQALSWAGDTDGARALLADVAAHPHLPDARDQAVDLMRDSAGPGGESAAPNPMRARPLFRETQPGETRVQGLLERIDCSIEQVTLVVKLADRSARYTASSLPEIQFISYRKGLNGVVDCGGRLPPDPVYITWKPGNLDGQVVAVEFLPGK